MERGSSQSNLLTKLSIGSRELSEITITCALGKLFEIILNNRLPHAKQILQKEDLHQFGLKEKSRAIHCALILNGVIDIGAGRRRPL